MPSRCTPSTPPAEQMALCWYRARGAGCLPINLYGAREPDDKRDLLEAMVRFGDLRRKTAVNDTEMIDSRKFVKDMIEAVQFPLGSINRQLAGSMPPAKVRAGDVGRLVCRVIRTTLRVC
ncbi:hypothetical protein BT67DRAFT_288653 [Trichocladium antarcticum]|uniref:Uncharacterized protein n=1 Tax=Trichocladium antarcticum TaxID=1450529 RepID=A0AAN6ZDE8_9PEZI|nr:hypothetical protein BT67DRAFT_288653 [Trichocladium antarcticum]